MPPKYSKYTLWHNILAVTLANSPERRAKLSHSIFFLYIWHRTRHKHFEQKNGRCSCRGTMYTYASCCGYGSFRGDPYLWISLVDHVRFGTDRGLLWTTCWLQPMINKPLCDTMPGSTHFKPPAGDRRVVKICMARLRSRGAIISSLTTSSSLLNWCDCWPRAVQQLFGVAAKGISKPWPTSINTTWVISRTNIWLSR